MFLILLTYTCPLDQVEPHLAAHREFLQHGYASGHFLMSGRREPRTGGVILAQGEHRAAIETLMHDDPFYRAGVTAMQIIEFIPTMTVSSLAALRID